MSAAISKTLLWLFVINLGVAFGAGVYEGRIVLPDWITAGSDGRVSWNPDAARRHDTGLRFWVFVTTVPLTLITLANLFGAWRASGRLRTWWLTAAVTAFVERVFTFSYFIPTMVGLMGRRNSDEAAAIATTWANLNYFRHALVLSAWLAALKAFAVLYERRRDT